MENQAFSELRLPSKKSKRAIWEKSLQVAEHMSRPFNFSELVL